jgi:sugar phosphate isomerase/epimerase
MQKLEVFQSLWAMELRRPGQAERPMEENFALAAEAGYHGLCVDPSVEEIPATRSLLPLFEKYGLKCMVNAFPHNHEEMRPLLEMAKEMNACHVNALGTEIPLSIAEGAATVQQWLSEAAVVGIPLLFETHRDSLLNDLGYTLQLLDAVPEMRLCADLSHFVVDRELRLPLSDLNRDYISRVLHRSDCFQGRVASSEQIQVQIDFPQHQRWVEQFKTWWADGIRWWRERNGDDATLVFLCELGPPIYAITDAQGLELSDRWQEALQIKKWIETIWSDAAR